MLRPEAHQIDDEITIRRLGPEDAAELERLAQRDSAQIPQGTVYASVDAEGSILAAISLETRALIADPFVPSAHAAALLRVWTGKLEEAARPRRIRRGLTVATTQPAPARTATPC